MSETPSSTLPLPPSAPPDRPSPRRRSSLGRALDRFRTAFRRRDSGIRDAAPTDQSSTLPQQSTGQNTEAQIPSASEPQRPSLTNARGDRILPFRDTVQLGLGADGGAAVALLDDSNFEDGADSLIPVALLENGSMSLSHEKARILFQKYGLTYDTRTPSSEPPVKVRRVEKPIRVRLRWTCHSCTTAFGSSKTCLSCGHTRCKECIRTPPKKVLKLLQSALPKEDTDAILRQTAKAAPDEEAVPVTTSVLPIIHKTNPDSKPIAQPAQSSNLGKNVKSEAFIPGPAGIRYTIHIGRPRTDFQLAHRPKAQIIRRACHECESNLTPVNRPDCQTCGHRVCNICVKYPDPPDPRKDPNAPPTSTTVPIVERVYRKPRQRVRFACEQCMTDFTTDRHKCGNCGHDRCDRCIRTPARKRKLAASGAESTAVEAKVAATLANTQAATADDAAL